MAKVTIQDVARVAGGSVATVDRVLNRRPGVRTVTWATRPAAPVVGTIVRVTDASNAIPVNAWELWGDNVTGGGGALACFMIWNGVNWTILGL